MIVLFTITPRPAAVSLRGSSLTILKEGVTSGHTKKQLLQEEWEVWGRLCVQCSPGKSAVETLSMGKVQEHRRTAWSSHGKKPSLSGSMFERSNRVTTFTEIILANYTRN